jgi:glutamate N-acetyltransferase/amino-acid N-acetyltransferase
MSSLVSALSVDGHTDAAQAIMTTDTIKKEFAVQFTLGGTACNLGGMAKGSGMIAPNMATMLCFLTTDAAIDAALLKSALTEVVEDTFNMMSVDGDTSTNDMVVLLANGAAGNSVVNSQNQDYNIFKAALRELCTTICRSLASDGEGATKLLECRVSGGASIKDAKLIAKSVINSSLLKAAMFGSDANWGRVLCAIGYSGANVCINGVRVIFRSSVGSVHVCENGAGIEFSEDDAKKVLNEKEILIDITLNDGNASATAWGCDLTYDYVRINGDYRS